MFNNKKDPLVDAVKKIMEQNEKEREAVRRVNEAFGVHSKKALPHELHAKYDAMLEEANRMDFAPSLKGKISSAPKQAVPDSIPGESSGEAAERKNIEAPVPRHPDNAETTRKIQMDMNRGLREAKKCMAEKLDPVNKEDEDVDNDGDVDNSDSYLKNRRKAISKNMKEDKLEEAKATEAQKEKVAKVMHKWKKGKEHIGKSDKTVPVTKKGQKQAVAIALSQAGLSKKKMDESNSFNLVQEEICINLLERINYIYENEGEDAANAFIETLSEEERGILSELEWRDVGRGALEIGKDMLGVTDFQKGNYGTAALKLGTTFAGGAAAKGLYGLGKAGLSYYRASRAAKEALAATSAANTAREALKNYPGLSRSTQGSGGNLGGIKADIAMERQNLARTARDRITDVNKMDVNKINASVAAASKEVGKSALKTASYGTTASTLNDISTSGGQPPAASNDISTSGGQPPAASAAAQGSGKTISTPTPRPASSDKEEDNVAQTPAASAAAQGSGKTISTPTPRPASSDKEEDNVAQTPAVGERPAASAADAGGGVSRPAPRQAARPTPKEPVDREWQIALGKTNQSPTTSKYFSGGGGA